MEHLFALNAILLFALGFPLVMKYRILPVEGTPYWLFGVLFVLWVGNCALAFFRKQIEKKLPVQSIRNVILVVSLTLVIGGITWTSIADRHRVAPVWGVHDIILQQEAAMRYLVTGKNPYKETYFGTPVESFKYDEMGEAAVNPALYHFVMPPWYLLFPFSVYVPANRLFGYFDGRMVSLLCLLGTLYILWRWFHTRELGVLAIILTALSPGIVEYFIEGRSDAFALFWMLLAFFLLDSKRYISSAIVFGLAFLSKQTIWFATPIFFVLLWLKSNSRKTVIRSVIATGIVVLALVTPFLLWDAEAFFASTVFYLSGSANLATSYPVSGYGFGMLLHSLGFIRSIHDYYPFTIWQILCGLPVLGFGIWRLKKQPKVSTALFVYGLFLCIVWYFSRYFNNSHVGVVAQLLGLALLKQADEYRENAT